ncbi:MAG: hypothetical protein FD128_398 [Hyphomonadaceae bacterium]|nr:MAG: hypothetical protein FD128_398 [Hyphomonadaceae bacterium]
MRDENISYDEIIHELNISKATLRNWVKLGHLKTTSKNNIERASFEKFRGEVIGNGKLVARANKTQQSRSLVSQFKLPAWEVLIALSSDALTQLALQYEAELAHNQRNIKGVYYTPQSIARETLAGLGELGGKTFLDPCCGIGNFLLAAIDAGFSPADIYGFDIDTDALLIAKARVFKKSGLILENIQYVDYLQSSPPIPANPDYIFTNPPWGVKMPAKEKARLAKKYGLPKSADSSAIFAAAILEHLNENGTAGLLLPEAFFNIAAYREVRRKILGNKIVAIKDYGRAFAGLLTKAQAIVFSKQAPEKDNQITCDFDGVNYRRNQNDFANNPNQIFNFYCNEKDVKIIKHLFGQPHKTLASTAKWALGIVTGDNKTHILNAPIEGAVPIYRGNDITPNGIIEPSNWIEPNFEKLQQTAPVAIYNSNEKIAYRFISSNLCFGYDDAKRLFLNSANILIPDPKLGISTANLTKLLNTKLLGWIFAKIFNTPKILRGDLEL